MLIINREQVEALLDMDRLIAALAPAMAELSAGRVSMPQRVAAQVAGKGLLGVMPAYLSATRTLACKLVSVFPQNSSLGLPTHQAVVMLFDAETGEPKAMLDGASITALRTAAGSALATKLLARPDADVLLIIGTGVQARTHVHAVPRVRKIKELRVAGRDAGRTATFADELSDRLGLKAKAYAIGPDAFAGAHIVCATTHAEEPVVQGAWLEPGMHINSVGLNQRGQELDVETLQRARLFVESRAAALAPPPSGANELQGAGVQAEIGELVAGARPGRTEPGQITLYKSVGVAVQDAVAAQLVYDAALRESAGLEVNL
ncbi:MAG TPA: ornithine cyclodeaminase family protein [Gammaproteobacteria bacterium]|jgi:ornithine cyclodeaminase|nr:ornithine cyclodeaminase family protein [Gammaproteobacteria bacterium]